MTAEFTPRHLCKSGSETYANSVVEVMHIWQSLEKPPVSALYSWPCVLDLTNSSTAIRKAAGVTSDSVRAIYSVGGMLTVHTASLTWHSSYDVAGRTARSVLCGQRTLPLPAQATSRGNCVSMLFVSFLHRVVSRCAGRHLYAYFSFAVPSRKAATIFLYVGSSGFGYAQ